MEEDGLKNNTTGEAYIKPGIGSIQLKLAAISSRAWLGMILATAVLLRVATSVMLGDAVEALPGIFDQISYHTLALRLLGGYGFTFATQWWPITKAGAPTAHWSYLYTLFLTGVYMLDGPHPFVVRLIQAIISGLLSPWLIYRIARRTFSSGGTEASVRIGLLAAAWMAIYPYFLYYSAALMTETYFIAGVLWIIDAAQRLVERDYENRIRIWNALELGLAIGIAALLRQLIMLFVPIIFLWIWWACSKDGGARLGAAFRKTFLIGIISFIVVGALIAPFTALNYRHFGQFVLLNTNSGYAFFWGNHPIYGDQFVPILTEDMPSYQDLIPQELRSLNEAALDQALLKRGLSFVTADPVRYLKLSLSRIPAYFMFWPAAESSLPSNLTRVFSFGLALPFMLLGVGVWRDDVRKKPLDPAPGVLLLLFALAFSAIHLLSWALIRYRLPVDAVMLIFAAYGLYFLMQKFSAWFIARR